MRGEAAREWLQWTKFRLRMALALRDPVPAEAASAEELDHLVELQLAHWRRLLPVAGAQAERLLHDRNQQSVNIFIISIRGKRVKVWDKPALADDVQRDPAMRRVLDTARRRILFYKTFIGFVVSRSSASYHLDFALDVSDIVEQQDGLPVFAFQKMRGDSTVLLPDVDFFHDKWYRQARDLLSYDDKTVSACFVGASTGGDLSLEGVQNDELPRLRAAHYFHDSPDVYFKIAKAVQCLGDEARLLLQSKPYFSARVDWHDQLTRRFIISMDGNGAACSRLVRGLMSNGAVIKYDSPHEVYYVPALTAGRDYILVRSDSEVAEVVRAERESPGRFRPVAESGQRFARKYLQIGSVVGYTDRLLASYASVVEEARRGC